MARQDVLLAALNRGEVSTQLLARTDLEHLRLAAQVQENWQPRVLGPSTFRPGSEYLGTVNQGNVQTTFFPFVASSIDRAAIELTPNLLRAWVVSVDGKSVDLVTRAAVSTTIPLFGSGGWVVIQQTGTANISLTSGGLAFNNLNIGANATVAAQVTIASGDAGVEHAVRFGVGAGPISFSIGTSQGADDLFPIENLDTGLYSMAFTPPTAGSIWITISAAIGPENFNTLTNSQPQGIFLISMGQIAIESPGPMSLATPWGASVLTDLANQRPTRVRPTASADVLFLACPGIAQQQINRYSPTSWSVVLYKPVKGPMSAAQGTTATVLSVDVLTGNGSLTSNTPTFSPDDVGTLFRLFHNGQIIQQNLSFNGSATDAVRITGVSTISVVSGGTIVDVSVPDRDFFVTLTGSWSGNAILQRSFSGYTVDFANYVTYNSNGSHGIIDSLNNEIVWYRVLDTATGTMGVTIDASGNGGGAGVCVVTSYISPTQVTMEVLVPFFHTGAAFDWRQSQWSPLQGFPTATSIHEGRLWWAGADRWWGSTSDDYTNFDFDEIGDAAYIDVTVGEGPIANINWLLSLDTLLGGGDTQIIAARSDAIQDPLTPTNFNLRFAMSEGSSQVQAVKIDNRAIFVNQSTRRIYAAVYDIATYNYKTIELSNLNPDIGVPSSTTGAGGIGSGGYIGMAVQRNPDTIIHLIRSDGQIVCLLNDVDDDVKAFWRKTTLGQYDNVISLPDTIEDMILVSVIRNGVRYFERFARLDECAGGPITKLCDSFGSYSGPPTYTISAPWLANQQVSVWIDGTDACLTKDDQGQQPAGFTYDAQGRGVLQLDRGGNATLQTAFENAIFGLPYKAKFLSTKLAYAAQQGSAINEDKRVDHIGFVLQNTHNRGIAYQAFVLNPKFGLGSFGPDFGTDFDTGVPNPYYDNLSPLDDMPLVEEGAVVEPDIIWAFYDQTRFEFPDNTRTDSRIYVEAASPRPATILGITFSIETND